MEGKINEEKINEDEKLNLLGGKNKPIECHKVFQPGFDLQGDISPSYSILYFILINIVIVPLLACFEAAFLGTNITGHGNPTCVINDEIGSHGKIIKVDNTKGISKDYLIETEDRIWAALFLLTFICGVIGLAVGIAKSFLILTIIGAILLAIWLFGSIKAAIVKKDSETYYVQFKYKKPNSRDKHNELEIANSDSKQQINKFDSNDLNWYLLVVARPFDEKKTNLNIVPIQNNFPDKIKFNRLRTDEI